MVELRRSMDDHSREVYVNGLYIGFFQWHPGRPPALEIWSSAGTRISLTDLERIMELGKEAMKLPCT